MLFRPARSDASTVPTDVTPVASHRTGRTRCTATSVGLRRLLATVLLAIGSAPVWAAPATVCIAGTTPCFGSDLRAAIAAASPGALILIGAGEVTQLDIVIGKPITLRGQGAGQTIVQADATPGTAMYRVITVGAAATAVIEDLTIRHGFVMPASGGGGGILNAGNLTLNRVVVSNNATRPGQPDGGSAEDGGGIRNTGILTVNHSTITLNATGRGGDALTCPGANCRSGNGGNGGGLASSGPDARLTLRNSTISSNFAGGRGSCNSMPGCTPGTRGSGGGVYADSGTDTLASVTITGNVGDGAGGLFQPAIKNVLLGNSVVTGNLNVFGEASDCNANAVTGLVPRGYNVVGAGCTAYTNLGDVSEPDATKVLNTTLADNGGPTPTHALVTNSPAINMGNPAAAGTDTWACTVRDQRGRLRNGACDSGAFEFDGAISNPTVTIDQALSQPDPTNVSPVRFTVTFSEPVRGFSVAGITVSTQGAVAASVLGIEATAPYDGSSYEVRVSIGSGTGTVSAYVNANAATDVYGNPNLFSVSTDNTVTIAGDSTPPVITPTVTGTLGANGWYTSDVTVSWNVTDNESFVSFKSGCLPTTVSHDTAGQTLTCSASSSGGQASRSVTVKRDATAPSVGGVISPNPVRLGGTVNVAVQASDAMSGIAVAACGTVSAAVAGLQFVDCTATDQAGNRRTVSVPYTVEYAAAGFLSPAPKSKWKIGQTVPIKIVLTDASGVRIPDAEAAALASSCRIAFAATGAQTASGCLRYDAANRQFIFNWALGNATGPATIAAAITYPGSTVATTVTASIQITR